MAKAAAWSGFTPTRTPCSPSPRPPDRLLRARSIQSIGRLRKKNGRVFLNLAKRPARRVISGSIPSCRQAIRSADNLWSALRVASLHDQLKRFALLSPVGSDRLKITVAQKSSWLF